MDDSWRPLRRPTGGTRWGRLIFVFGIRGSLCLPFFFAVLLFHSLLSFQFLSFSLHFLPLFFFCFFFSVQYLIFYLFLCVLPFPRLISFPASSLTSLSLSFLSLFPFCSSLVTLSRTLFHLCFSFFSLPYHSRFIISFSLSPTFFRISCFLFSSSLFLFLFLLYFSSYSPFFFILLSSSPSLSSLTIVSPRFRFLILSLFPFSLFPFLIFSSFPIPLVSCIPFPIPNLLLLSFLFSSLLNFPLSSLSFSSPQFGSPLPSSSSSFSSSSFPLSSSPSFIFVFNRLRIHLRHLIPSPHGYQTPQIFSPPPPAVSAKEPTISYLGYFLPPSASTSPPDKVDILSTVGRRLINMGRGFAWGGKWPLANLSSRGKRPKKGGGVGRRLKPPTRAVFCHCQLLRAPFTQPNITQLVYTPLMAAIPLETQPGRRPHSPLIPRATFPAVFTSP
ncbi:hypothetical protein C7M84_025287 [Penaeus vannamei]|uniref:Uncharacterized protein n=1 Tax=Penaeus vannamei TaxID=6689 RepID=A0A3R7NA71_PENVA|nr:hypothetical protein C7M84_025287 [Penaeus vannamei]